MRWLIVLLLLGLTGCLHSQKPICNMELHKYPKHYYQMRLSHNPNI